MKKSIAGFVLAVACAASWALPTSQQVETAVQQGHYAQAETMMGEVVAAKPDSAKAHYVYAEILAHNGSFAKAAEETKRARQIDPDLKFTQPEKFKAFEQLLQREQTPAAQPRVTSPTFTPAAAAAPASEHAGIPGWVWGGGLALLAFVLWRGFSRSRAMPPGAAAAGIPGAAGAGGPPYAGPGVPYGTAMPAPSAGSGLLGTGLAVAGGVAGGMLLDEMLHHRQGSGASPLDRVMPGAFEQPAANDAANELESRPVDFGNGGDWDAGGSDGGGGWD